MAVRTLARYLAVVLLVASSGCRAVRMSADVAEKAVDTSALVVSHAGQIAASALSLHPRGVVKHTMEAAQDTVGGAFSITGGVLHEILDAVD